MMARASLQHNQRQSLRRVGLLPYSCAVPAQQGRGFDSPFYRRSSRAGYPTAAFLLRSVFRFYGGTCGEGRKLLPEPVAGLSTPHVLPPSFDSGGGGFVDPSYRSQFMADAPCGAAAPIPPTGIPARPVSEAKRHFCSRCGHSGDYAGTGPHTCPGCDCELMPVPPGVAPILAVDPAAFPNTSTTVAATLADHPPQPTARTLPTWPATDCADRVRYELHPVLAGLSLLTNLVRVLRAVDDYATLSGSFADALKDACPSWADPFAHGGEASAESVVSDLARYAADLCAEILVMDMNGGAA